MVNIYNCPSLSVPNGVIKPNIPFVTLHKQIKSVLFVTDKQTHIFPNYLINIWVTNYGLFTLL